MDASQSKLKVEGKIPLHGEVYSSGSKNAALPILAATILMDGAITLTNVPYLHDIISMIKILKYLGVRTEFLQPGIIKIFRQGKVKHIAPYDLIAAMRASFFVAGPILAYTGFAKIPLPGGCSIGDRPVDIHLKGFEALGAKIRIEHGFVELRAKKLVGNKIRLDFPSVGATENIMMAATLAEGRTIIENAAQEPEIEDLSQFLIAAGAKISGVNTSVIQIDGVRSLKGVEHRIIADRIEVGTLLIAAGITKGNILVHHTVPAHVQSLLSVLKQCGLAISIEGSSIRCKYDGYLDAINIETQPFPGFPTDMQAQMIALLTLAKGTSHIKETIFENRFMHVSELSRMGANIELFNNVAAVEGVSGLSGADVQMTDLRAGASLLLAAMAAEGKSIIYGLSHLKRGYDDLPAKLRSIGASVN